MMRGAISGTRQKIQLFYSIDANCVSEGYPEVRIIAPPKNGQIAIEHGEDFPNFAQDNVRYACNKAKVAMDIAYFTPNSDFTGTDSATLKVIFVSGSMRTYQFTFNVLK